MGRNKNTRTINGITYERMYDKNGELTNEEVKALLSGKDIEKAIEELQQFDLMEVIEIKGVKYYRTLDPKPKNIPLNVLNL